MNPHIPFLGGVVIGVVSYLIAPKPTRRVVQTVDESGLGAPLVGLAASRLPPGPGQALIDLHARSVFLPLPPEEV